MTRRDGIALEGRDRPRGHDKRWKRLNSGKEIRGNPSFFLGNLAGLGGRSIVKHLDSAWKPAERHNKCGQLRPRSPRTHIDGQAACGLLSPPRKETSRLRNR